jgi:hypothetical protein
VNAPTWAEVARGARDALHNLGYPVRLGCLPGEAAPCGGNDAEHVASYLAAIKAIADHQLEHLGPAADPLASTVYRATLLELGNHAPPRHTEFSSLNDD